MSYVPLRNYSQYSIGESILILESWLKFLSEQKVMAAGCCDKNNLFGMVRFYQQALKYRIKPLIGCEVLYDWSSKSRPLPLILYAKDHQGYQNLSRILTSLYQQEQGLILSAASLAQYTCGVIAIIPPESFEMFIKQHQIFQKLFKETCVLGIERYPHHELSLTKSHQILDFSQRAHYPVVALNAVYFLKEEDYQTQQIKVCIQQGQYIQDENRCVEQHAYHHARSCAEMEELYGDCPQVLKNTQLLAQKCTLSFQWGQVLLPQFSDDEVASLQRYAQEGLQQRFADGHIRSQDRDSYEERLQQELQVIPQMGFAGYFLIVADFIQWAKSQKIIVGPGRGSGAGSLVAYALKITDIDPLAYGLLFERFLNPERVSMPDFDIDFCMIGRDRVIEYVQQRYGRDHVSQIATFGTMAAKAVIRDVGRVHSLPFPFVDKIAKMIPLQIGITLDDALEQNIDFKTLYEEDEQVHELINHARKLEGLPRNVGRHAGGVIIAPRPLAEICPLYSESPQPWQPVSHLDKDDIEQLGLVKFDFLGLKTLTIIDWTYQKAHAMGITLPPLDQIPLDDPASYRVLNTGHSTAIFQLESKSMRDLIIRLQPDCFEDIIAIVALNRPGPLQSGMVDDFIERKHGRQVLAYPHPWTEPLLKETYGVILYQEQVMQLAQNLAGYTLGAADLLRRAMGKKKPEEMAKQRDIFVQGASNLGIDSQISNGIFDLMEKFAGYGFNKSHSAAYALIVFQTLYLKTHATAAFMAATMTADHMNFDKIALFAEDLPHFGVVLKPPCVQSSYTDFEPEGPQAIRYGLCAIKGLGQTLVSNLVAQRQKVQGFTSWCDFLEKAALAGLTAKSIELLIKCGACDCFYSNRRWMLESLLPVDFPAVQKKISGQKSLFDSFEEKLTDTTISAPLASIADFDWSERLSLEMTLLGVSTSGGVFDPYSWIETDLWVLSPKQAESHKPCLLLYHSSRYITTQKGSRLLILQFVKQANAIFEIILQPDSREQDKSMAHDLIRLSAYTPILAYLSFSTGKNNPQKVYTSLTKIVFLQDFFYQNNVEWVFKVFDAHQEKLAHFIATLTKEQHRPKMIFEIYGSNNGAALLKYELKKQVTPQEEEMLAEKSLIRWIEQAYAHHQTLGLNLKSAASEPHRLG